MQLFFFQVSQECDEPCRLSAIHLQKNLGAFIPNVIQSYVCGTIMLEMPVLVATRYLRILIETVIYEVL